MAKYERSTLPSQKLLLKEAISVKETVPDFLLENPNISVDKSIEFMKKLMVVAVSSIAFLRDLFPAHAFSQKKLFGQSVFVLKGTEDAPGTSTLIELIKSGFDLVHSHHLKRFILLIQKDSVTLEMYSFSFVYNHELITCEVLGEINGNKFIHEQTLGLPADIEKSSRQLVRCILTHVITLNPLPNDCQLSVQLQVDENIPVDMIPQAYQCSAESDHFDFLGEVETLMLGKVETKFTTFEVSSKTAMLEGTYTGAEVNQEERLTPVKDVEDVEDMVSVSASQEETETVFRASLSSKTNFTAAEGWRSSAEIQLLSEGSTPLQEKLINCSPERDDLCDTKFDSFSTSQDKDMQDWSTQYEIYRNSKRRSSEERENFSPKPGQRNNLKMRARKSKKIVIRH